MNKITKSTNYSSSKGGPFFYAQKGTFFLTPNFQNFFFKKNARFFFIFCKATHKKRTIQKSNILTNGHRLKTNMGFFKKVFRETTRVVHQASAIPIVGPLVVPIVVATVPLAAPVLAAAAVVNDPRHALPALVGSVVAPELAPLIAAAADPKHALPALVGSVVAPELAPVIAAAADPKHALPALVGSVIAPDIASVPIVRVHIANTAKPDNVAPFWLDPDIVGERDFTWPLPNNLPVPAPAMRDDYRPFWAEDEEEFLERRDRDLNFKFIPIPEQLPKKIEITGTCEAALMRADAVCEAAGDSSLPKFGGGDMVAQGLICKAAIEEAKKACE